LGREESNSVATSDKFSFYPVILAGGRGTRFWPLSRKRMAKQLLPLNSKKSMIQETVERLSPLAKAKQFWIITNQDLRPAIVGQLKGLPKRQIIAEPVGRNTAPAIGLAAFLLERSDPTAVIGMFPSDHVIVDEKRFRADIGRAARIAAAGENIVVIGITPTRAETGYGYIEVGEPWQKGVLQVRRFTEKPLPEVAEQFVKAGNFFWNSGMFIWSARTLANALREHLPNTAPLLEKIAASYGSRSFEKTFAKLYPKCENISVDYAVLEPRSAKGEDKSHIYCIPAHFGWNDLGSWTALYEHRNVGKNDADNVIVSERNFTLNAEGNFIHSKRKFVAVVGVKNLIVVETDDALLITTREHAQDVGKVVKHLDEQKLKRLV
jgi:mannose-1-phosphate guanylyltransferase